MHIFFLAGTRDREIDDIWRLQGVGILMAGTDDITNDDIESRQGIDLDLCR